MVAKKAQRAANGKKKHNFINLTTHMLQMLTAQTNKEMHCKYSLIMYLFVNEGFVGYGGRESSTCCNFRKHMQIEKAPANQENVFIN